MARAAGTNVPESIKINSNLAIRRYISGWSGRSVKLVRKE